MYSWSITNWIERVLPYFLRNNVQKAWLYVLIKPVQTLHSLFLSKAVDLDYKLKYNSQQQVLSALLNNIFDNTLRRIYVQTDSDFFPTAVVYLESEIEATAVLYKEVELNATEVLYNDSEVEKSGYFTVYAPSSLSSKTLEIQKWIAYYQLAATNFKIVFI